MTDPEIFGEASNRLCGDQVSIFGIFDADKRKIRQLSFSGQSCAVCRASASILTEFLVGKTCEQGLALLSSLEQFSRDWEPSGVLGDFSAFVVIKDFKTRHRCLSLPWQAAQKAISQVASDHESMKN
jgi:nitrogen fixation NifU-like protein